MHETGVMMEIVHLAEKHAKKSGATKVYKLVLQIGQLSAVIPDAAKMCYPFVINGTMLEQCKLAIEVVPAIGVCKQCDSKYNLVEQEFKCPNCSSDQYEILSGRELKIKELIAM
ncbi:hydrogenase maturation nickel metallochaperone HypA [Sporomusa sphaeroides]|uniref:hydrogenase maturation nickel metallochaperone HypA n=1 Tax=Sporomusa sphaeroides TaxID=47679 RepID=UPI002C82A2D9|nr:hydrogenase maturation nickel metallochaperone HypA [Sporomusa sphaeroides]HML31846.1 hydrogenase maturation nickel metallochaperone HypA [Sporomusa sphaeroides]